MKTIIVFLFLLPVASTILARQVPQKDAQQIAVAFYRLNNPAGISIPMISSGIAKSLENNPLLYIFRFVSGGFVIVSADDACIPILGYSFENEIQEHTINPAFNNWLDRYMHEIDFIVRNNLDNTETLLEWQAVKKVWQDAPLADVGPLLTTSWDQNCNYNAFCPPDAGGECGHTYTGCVATAMSQIMKFHNYPPKGIGQHAYADGNYGQQSADFGNTSYDWAAMPNMATAANDAIATIMHHAGVSMDMGYGANGSGGQSDYIHTAFVNYFNYSPGIEIKYRDSYVNAEEFKTLLRNDLDAHLPIHYAGYGPYGGHDFVCDGYRMSDGKFHFNWGWGGSADGYFAIGSLNPNGYPFNTGDMVTVHIKPYNPDLIVRIQSPADKLMVTSGTSVLIKAKVVKGSAAVIKILIDGMEKLSSSGDSISYTWNPANSDLGSHRVEAFAMNAQDTVYCKTLLNVGREGEWVSQLTGFPAPRAITGLSAIDSNIVWAIASNAGNPLWATSSDFARTTNGGITWTPGVVTNTAGLIPSMIFGIDSLNACVAMFKITGTNTPGIYKTSDGGATWARQSTAFTQASSCPQVVHFFSASDGVCVGNPYNSEYEIYTTSNGGNTWIQVPGGSIPNPATADVALGGCYSAVHDTIWFGTALGRVYRSTDKGLHWTVSAPAIMSGKYVKPVFRNGSHGLLLDEISGTGLLCETFDGGITWIKVDYTGPDFGGDLAYIPGTENTWVRSGFLTGLQGCAYSRDGGHTWSDFQGTTGSPFARMTWVNSHCGWSGGHNTNLAVDGVFKFIGSLALPPVGIDHTGNQTYLKIYPNPVHGSVTITAAGPVRGISIIDQSGHALPVVSTEISESQFMIDLTRVIPGIYFITVMSEGRKSMATIVVY